MAYAATFENDDFSIEVPAGFTGPNQAHRIEDGHEIRLFAFTRPHVQDATNTLLMVSTFSFDMSLPRASAQELQEAGDKYLVDFLKGIERQRTSYSEQPIRHVKLNGVPFSVRSWQGVLLGRLLTGVMYCGITETKALCVQTQDFKEFAATSLEQALAAIETLQVKHPFVAE
jgi:hypothetical protein